MPIPYLKPAIRLCAAALTLLLLSAGTHAEVRAVLVGVSEYPSLPAKLQLKGPANDVALMRTLLLRRGVPEANLQVLTEGATLPTRANIMAALARVAQDARAGDDIFLLFAGHGSRQPVADADLAREPDGYDEIFLPRDIGPWVNATESVQNAITDNDVRTAINAIRARGAFVWAVFDSCHSATMTRGANASLADVRYRDVPPHALNIPVRATAASTRGDIARIATDGAGDESRGGSVGFFAAQTTEQAPERNIDTGEGARVHGVFTWMIAQGLARNTPFTYRQLGQYVLQRYAANGFYGPTPAFEGDGLDRVVLGGQAGGLVDQWPLSFRRESAGTWTPLLPAGALEELRAGEVLDIFPDALAAADQRIGSAPIAQLRLAESVLGEARDTAGKPLDWQSLRDKPPVLRRAQLSVRNDLVVGVAPALADAPAAVRKKVLDATRAAATQMGQTVVKLVDNADADLLLHVENNRLWLLPRSGTLTEQGSGHTPSYALDDASAPLATRLATDLPRIARGINLLRLGGVFPGDVGSSNDFTVRIEACRSDCKSATAQWSELDIARPADLVAGNHLRVTLENGKPFAMDVGVLFVGADWSIDLLYPWGKGESSRMEPRDPKTGRRSQFTIPMVVNADTAGLERLLVIATPAPDNAAVRSYAHLAQAGIGATTTTRGFSDPLDLLLGDAVSTRTRGAPRDLPKVKPSMFSWSLRVSP